MAASDEPVHQSADRSDVSLASVSAPHVLMVWWWATTRARLRKTSIPLDAGLVGAVIRLSLRQLDPGLKEHHG